MPPHPTPCLGLVGGLGVGATLSYYQALAEACRRRGVLPALFIAHADVSRVLSDVGQNRLTDLAGYLAGYCNALRRHRARAGF